MTRIYKRNSGIALVLVVGVLSILAMVSVGFSAFSRLELQATQNYVNQFKAELIAEAGISRAIEELKYGDNGAQKDPYDTSADAWYYQDGVNVDLAVAANPSFGAEIPYFDGTYKLKVIDCAGLININTPLPDSAAEAEFKSILSGLASEVGVIEPQKTAFVNNLIPCRNILPDKIFRSKEEIKLVTNIGQATYEKVKDFITLYGDEDDGIVYLNKSGKTPVAGHTRKVFVNVNTAPKEVLKAVLGPMISGDEDDLAEAIVIRRNLNPFDGKDSDVNVNNFLSARGEFRRFLEYQRSPAENVITSDADLDNLLKFTDPNRYDPLDRSPTTCFCFDSGGCYEIEALGKYCGAKKTIRKAICIYRKIYETTKDEFLSCDPTSVRVTCKDSCPVDYNVLKTDMYIDDPKVIVANSVKPGFWDDFEEDYDTSGNDKGEWLNLEQRFEINKNGDGFLRTWPNGAFIAGMDYFPKMELDSNKWRFNRFSLRARIIDETTGSKSALRTDMPWPVVPDDPSWQGQAPAPMASNCPDIASGEKTVDQVNAFVKSYDCHERFLNVAHIQFGLPPNNMSALYCSFPQTEDILTHTIDIYGQWVNYDGSGYIYFAPTPDIKPQAVVSQPHLMVFCNDYVWAGHAAVEGTKHFLMPAYYPDKTIRFKTRDQRTLNASVFYPGGSMDVNTGMEPVEVWNNRIIRFVGMGNFFDMDNVRIIPERSAYTSKTFDPTQVLAWDTIEWGTICAGTFVSPNAKAGYNPGDTECIYITTSFTAGEDVQAVPGPGATHPAGALQVSGGFIDLSTNPAITYRAYFYSGYNDVATNYEEIPVLEDITITYMPKTVILSQSSN